MYSFLFFLKQDNEMSMLMLLSIKWKYIGSKWILWVSCVEKTSWQFIITLPLCLFPFFLCLPFGLRNLQTFKRKDCRDHPIKSLIQCRNPISNLHDGQLFNVSPCIWQALPDQWGEWTQNPERLDSLIAALPFLNDIFLVVY